MIEQSLALLGLEAKDRITGFSGVISSITFDLYGCVQAIITPGLGKDGKPLESHWFDVKRLEVAKKRRMDMPKFGTLKFGDEQGPGDRPRSMPSRA